MSQILGETHKSRTLTEQELKAIGCHDGFREVIPVDDAEAARGYNIALRERTPQPPVYKAYLIGQGSYSTTKHGKVTAEAPMSISGSELNYFARIVDVLSNDDQKTGRTDFFRRKFRFTDLDGTEIELPAIPSRRVEYAIK